MNDFDSTDENMDRFLTVTEAAELLKVSAADVHELIDSGELQAFRVGKRGPWRIEHEILELFIAEQYEDSRRSAMWNNSSLASANNVVDF
ncbi:excisionase family DNA binding protein [Aurantimicrobium minutum]|uniref:helix-turn-helix domain-containing protein n=1 Tax=Aurantimicrobium minutum TaxID=708131 RepID=UPI002473C887|nr:helix-turn-helix domain-containing protein [Aurantimicrobium minutum]MDH6410559.1 excisionase family DNA binding protein [Aurantimicrobium minutum]